MKKELAQSIDSARLIETKLQGGNSSNTVESIKPYGRSLKLNYRSLGEKQLYGLSLELNNRSLGENLQKPYGLSLKLNYRSIGGEELRVIVLVEM